eukprot:5355558-Alexandrium_andersonii.AAC.1
MRPRASKPQRRAKWSWHSRAENWDRAPELCTVKYRRLRPKACSGRRTRSSRPARQSHGGRGARGR